MVDSLGFDIYRKAKSSFNEVEKFVFFCQKIGDKIFKCIFYETEFSNWM